jgi:hypothetical protein
MSGVQCYNTGAVDAVHGCSFIYRFEYGSLEIHMSFEV